jgi:hypothetical protein
MVRMVRRVRRVRFAHSVLVREDGIALLVAIMAMLLLTALGGALALTTSSETMIAANFRRSAEELYAADAGLGRVIDELRSVPDWNAVRLGLVGSSFVDGPPSGLRILPDGSTIDLRQIVNLANCEKTVSCTDTEMDSVTPDRPWAAANPRWVLTAYGPLGGLLTPGAANSTIYLVILVAAGVGPATPPIETLAVRAEAFGSRGGRKVVEAAVARTDEGVRVLSWRTVR